MHMDVPNPLEISAFLSPLSSPSEIPLINCEGGMDIFWNDTQGVH